MYAPINVTPIEHSFLFLQTDAVTLHGLDNGDRQALLSLFGDKVNTKVNQGVTSMVVKEVEHMNVRARARELEQLVVDQSKSYSASIFIDVTR